MDQVGPSTKIGQAWAKIGQSCTEVDHHWPEFGQVGSVRLRPEGEDWTQWDASEEWAWEDPSKMGLESTTRGRPWVPLWIAGGAQGRRSRPHERPRRHHGRPCGHHDGRPRRLWKPMPSGGAGHEVATPPWIACGHPWDRHSKWHRHGHTFVDRGIVAARHIDTMGCDAPMVCDDPTGCGGTHAHPRLAESSSCAGGTEHKRSPAACPARAMAGSNALARCPCTSRVDAIHEETTSAGRAHGTNRTAPRGVSGG